MSNGKAEKKEVAKQSTETSLDGFTGFIEGAEGDDRPQGGAVIHGTLIKFTNEATWVTSDGDELSREREFVAVGTIRIVQKWIDQKPEETIFVEPGEPFPDVKAMNEKAPKSEWHEDLNGKMVGPWQAQHVLYLVDPQTLDKFSYPTSTLGGTIALRELCDKIKWLRAARHNPNAHAVVTLSDKHMNTRFGGRQRPHFNVARFIELGGDGELPAPKPLALESGEVKEPTLKEELNDDLPDHLK